MDEPETLELIKEVAATLQTRRLLVSDFESYDFVLGRKWLRDYNPDIDWVRDVISSRNGEGTILGTRVQTKPVSRPVAQLRTIEVEQHRPIAARGRQREKHGTKVSHKPQSCGDTR